ncbi:hypothetical protein BPAE_0184g00180 [Botrytis paeoniae]|uniref:FAD/NAD(P)-binding domain-containing protein n=1 Tax=Botrytis paeoniae TaxID=278948 RepID=A0A4Z1FC05_9HELO|nr:hypothetical protein BPAE_0184g00180 [Botrytis paeoniae]
MTSTHPTLPPYPLVDVLIIGAGPAGISCAAALARFRHTAIVFSSNKFRNEDFYVDHRDPSELRAASREGILARYKTIYFEDVGIQTVEKISKNGDGEGSSFFKAIDDIGKDWWGRKLVLATGVGDILVDIEGYEECWAKSIFHCLYCHDYKSSPAQSAGVLAIGDCASPHIALHLARQALRLSENVTTYTHGNNALTEEIETAKVVSNPNVKSKCRITKQTKDFAHQLDIELTEQGDIKVTAPFNETSVRGSFETGDRASMLKNVVGAMYSGTRAAAGVGSQIQGED